MILCYCDTVAAHIALIVQRCAFERSIPTAVADFPQAWSPVSPVGFLSWGLDEFSAVIKTWTRPFRVGFAF